MSAAASRLARIPAARRRQAGFSLPELISVMVVTLMFSGLIMYFALEYWRSTATLQTDLETLNSRLNAGDIIRDAINESSGMIIQNSIADAHAMAPDPSIATNTFWAPVHAVPGTISIGASGTYTPVAYFRKPAVDSSKNVILNGTQPYEDEYVLYMDGSRKELLMRTLANPSAPGDRAVTSCPPALATAACPADRIVAEDVSSVDMRYFSRAGNTIDYHSVVDSLTGQYVGPDFPVVEVIEFNLHLARKSQLHGGQDTANQTVIRVALRSS